MTFIPTACHIRKHGQDRQLIIIVPKNVGIVPEKQEAEDDDDQAGRESANYV